MRILKNWNLCHGFVIGFASLVLVIQTISALQLDSLVTKKPRLTKHTTKAPSSSQSSTSLYRVNSTQTGNTCILFRTDALLTIEYRDKLNEDIEADVYLPDYPALSGKCAEAESEMTLAFRGFTLSMYFSKTPGGERWYVNQFELTYSSSNPLFKQIDRPGLDVKLSTPPRTFLFPTPSGRSFECMQEQTIVMYSQDENDKSGHLARLLLRDTRLQGFMYRAKGEWGPAFQCSATGTYRDEAAPFYMGTILFIACISTVAGYGVWRYMKVKKFQYGNMDR